MHSLVTVVSLLKWMIAAFLVLTILHPAKADNLAEKSSKACPAIHASFDGCGSGCITAYCYPPTGRGR